MAKLWFKTQFVFEEVILVHGVSPDTDNRSRAISKREVAAVTYDELTIQCLRSSVEIRDKVGLPGSMFADSIKCLPPAKFASIID